MTPSEIAYFEARCEPIPPSTCVIWTGPLTAGRREPRAYGVMFVHRDGKRIAIKAHRVALMLATGIEGVMACHHCDVPLCVNPRHLYWGDAGTNAEDARARGRLRNTLGSKRPTETVRLLAKVRERGLEATSIQSEWHRDWTTEQEGIAREAVAAYVTRVERGDDIQMDCQWSDWL